MRGCARINKTHTGICDFGDVEPAKICSFSKNLLRLPQKVVENRKCLRKILYLCKR